LLNSRALILASGANLARRIKLPNLRQKLAKFKGFLFSWLWRVRFRVMSVLAFTIGKVVDAYIGEVISSILFR
jgi:hypothetical protein